MRLSFMCFRIRKPTSSTLFPYTTLFRSHRRTTAASCRSGTASAGRTPPPTAPPRQWPRPARSEEHTSELQSHDKLVFRLLLEKKKYSLQGDDFQARK